MVTGGYSEADVADAVLADTRLATHELRCRTLYEVAKWLAGRAGASVPERYATLSKGRCPDEPS